MKILGPLRQRQWLRSSFAERSIRISSGYPSSPKRKVFSSSLADRPLVACVTGCTGYIASEVVKNLLEKGFHVRGTVRDSSPPGKLNVPIAALAKTLPGSLEIIEADLLNAGSFDDVVAGCDYVFHTASPFLRGLDSQGANIVEQTLIRPALEGTANVLQSVAKNKATVQCTVVTSSVAAVHSFEAEDTPGGGRSVFNEEDWNTRSTQEAGAYLLSKTLAERKAWSIAELEGFKLCTINPSFVLGPPCTDREDGVSIQFGLHLLRTGELTLTGAPVVDVRDVAEAHVRAATYKYSAGRYILSLPHDAENWLAYENLLSADIVDTLLPKLVPVEKPDGAKPRLRFSAQKVQSSEGAGLGMQLKPLSKTLVDMVRSMRITHAKCLG